MKKFRELEEVTAIELETVKEAILILYKYGESYEAQFTEEAFDMYADFQDIEETDEELMTEEEATPLFDTLDIADSIGRYGVGDCILEAIGRHTLRDEEDNILFRIEE